MFKIVVCGGPCDGEVISTDGCVSFGAVPTLSFDDFADAQEWIIVNQGAVNRGDFGDGASLNVDEY